MLFHFQMTQHDRAKYSARRLYIDGSTGSPLGGARKRRSIGNHACMMVLGMLAILSIGLAVFGIAKG